MAQATFYFGWLDLESGDDDAGAAAVTRRRTRDEVEQIAETTRADFASEREWSFESRRVVGVARRTVTVDREVVDLGWGVVIEMMDVDALLDAGCDNEGIQAEWAAHVAAAPLPSVEEALAAMRAERRERGVVR